ncbi:hypothetical protein GCM10010254_00520 [Streptomyces chromofuscus]|nr:hypothetical protein GCM10010254_00520 [Streptomyces chromofuscus]
MHTRVPDAWDDARGEVHEAHEGAGPGDEDGDALGARTARLAAPPRFPLFPDRHRIP